MTTIDEKWHLALFGSRNLVGHLNEGVGLPDDFTPPWLEPVYQIEKRNTPVQGPPDPKTGQPTMAMARQWYIMAVAEFDSIKKVSVPDGAALIELSALSPGDQQTIVDMIGNYEKALAEIARKKKIADELAVGSGSFGGGARQ